MATQPSLFADTPAHAAQNNRPDTPLLLAMAHGYDFARRISPAQRALLAQDAAEQAFEVYISTGKGDGEALNAALISARAAYLRAVAAELKGSN